ncbi:hypothetical protein CJF31_00000895 [Rutstroemia sp. NJR-2017a BVV2]|nr:hypothetical protein CJF31_00000895 [Rutstroemia sp. NJR-2017a BVV2]
MAGTASFTRFRELPTELRLRIWENASFFQRIVELNYCVVDRKFSISGPPPAILYVNQESREIALKFYSKSFGTINQPAEIYFNAVSDIIYLSSRQYEDEVMAISSHFRVCAESLPHQDHIQTIALGERWWTDSPYSAFFRLSEPVGSIGKFRSTYPHLKKVILVRGAPSEEEVVSWDSYSGISLLPSREKETEDERAEFVLWAFDEFDHQIPRLDVVVMEHP